jgi:hypothetical protein
MLDEGHEKGTVVSEARFLQSKNMCFKNLIFRRGIQPTDIDFSFDFNDQLYFQGEGKLEGKGMDYGQRKHLECMSKRIYKGGAESFVIIFEHNITDPTEKVYVWNCKVTEIFSGREGKWSPPKKEITVLECIKQISKYCEDVLKLQL